MNNSVQTQGPFAPCWIAALWERKLSKPFVAGIDIQSTVRRLQDGDEGRELTLRVIGYILFGMAKIYQKQLHFLCHDAQEAYDKMKDSFKSPEEHKAVSKTSSSARVNENARYRGPGGSRGNTLQLNVKDILNFIDQNVMTTATANRLLSQSIELPRNQARYDDITLSERTIVNELRAMDQNQPIELDDGFIDALSESSQILSHGRALTGDENPLSSLIAHTAKDNAIEVFRDAASGATSAMVDNGLEFDLPDIGLDALNDYANEDLKSLGSARKNFGEVSQGFELNPSAFESNNLTPISHGSAKVSDKFNLTTPELEIMNNLVISKASQPRKRRLQFDTKTNIRNYKSNVERFSRDRQTNESEFLAIKRKKLNLLDQLNQSSHHNYMSSELASMFQADDITISKHLFSGLVNKPTGREQYADGDLIDLSACQVSVNDSVVNSERRRVSSLEYQHDPVIHDMPQDFLDDVPGLHDSPQSEDHIELPQVGDDDRDSDGFTTRTHTVLRDIEMKTTDSDDKFVAIEQLSRENTRSCVAINFYEMLVLAQHDMVEIQQCDDAVRVKRI